ncbi:MAG: transcriptional regulator [Spirochaetes bacterium]|nr:ArsR family transcriptional regulator [Thermoplasmata archaeon]RKX95352.1 MAG: transcriptional regulator [Spirochaetota bacterium]RLF63773.1 MAG: transcriptional regulator [Thermoplasmata archaeon]HDD57252.1 ArsR family transcriptional regulator [Thermoplasmatales archaeon]HEC86989.1 ArsR family transcriptional regulator [Thermoplasmatales archaeon]
MSFEIRVVSNTPLTGEKDVENATRMFLYQIGYLSKGSDPEIPYRIFYDFFLKHPSRAWMVEEISKELKVSKPTVYRHLNKLKGLDIIEDVQVSDDTGQSKKAYRLRYGNFEKAWNFVEAHLKVAIENYGKTVEHIQKLLEEKR